MRPMFKLSHGIYFGTGRQRPTETNRGPRGATGAGGRSRDGHLQFGKAFGREAQRAEDYRTDRRAAGTLLLRPRPSRFGLFLVRDRHRHHGLFHAWDNRPSILEVLVGPLFLKTNTLSLDDLTRGKPVALTKGFASLIL